MSVVLQAVLVKARPHPAVVSVVESELLLISSQVMLVRESL